MIISAKLEHFTKKDGTTKVYIYLYDPITRTKAKIPTEHYVNPKEWGLKQKPAHIQYIVSRLDRVRSDLRDYCLLNPGTSPLRLKEWYLNPKTQHTPVSYFEHYIKECEQARIVRKSTKSKLSESYIKTLRSNSKYLQSFNKVHPVTFDAIGEEFFNRFVAHMRTELKLGQNTIAKSIKILKIVCNHAFKKGVHSNKNFEDYSVSTVKAQKIRLTPDEVESIINLDLKDDPELVPEWERFQVAYNLLLRFGDSVAIKENNIVMRNKKPHLSAFTQKTRKEILLPIKKKVYEILKRNQFKIKGVNKTSNKRLKLLGMKAKINSNVTITEFKDGKKIETVYKKWQLIETHTTRRSAARNLFDAGLDPDIIQVLGGWSSRKQMLEYIDIDLDYAASKAADHPFFH